MNIEGLKIGSQNPPTAIEILDHVSKLDSDLRRAGQTAAGVDVTPRPELRVNTGYRQEYNEWRKDMSRATSVAEGGYGTIEDDAWTLFAKSGAWPFISQNPQPVVDSLSHISGISNEEEDIFVVDCPCYKCFQDNTSRKTGLHGSRVNPYGISYNDIDMCELEGDIIEDGHPRHNKTHLNRPFGSGRCDCMRDLDPHYKYEHKIEDLQQDVDNKTGKLFTPYCEGREQVKGGPAVQAVADLFDYQVDWGGGCRDIKISDQEKNESGTCKYWVIEPNDNDGWNRRTCEDCPCPGGNLDAVEAENLCNRSYQSTDGDKCVWDPQEGACKQSKTFCDEDHIIEFLEKIDEVHQDYTDIPYVDDENKRIPEGKPDDRPAWTYSGDGVENPETPNTHTLRRLVHLFIRGAEGDCSQGCWDQISSFNRGELIKVLEEFDLERSEHYLNRAHQLVDNLIKSKHNFDTNHLNNDPEQLKKKREYIAKTHSHRNSENYMPKCALKDNIKLEDATIPPEFTPDFNSGSPWVGYTADDGRLYYVHDETEERVWEKPAEGISGLRGFQNYNEMRDFCDKASFHADPDLCSKYSCMLGGMKDRGTWGGTCIEDLNQKNICEFKDPFNLSAMSNEKRQEWLNDTPSQPEGTVQSGLEKECWRHFGALSESAIQFFGDPSDNNNPNYPDGWSQQDVWPAHASVGGIECMCRDELLKHWRGGRLVPCPH